MRFSDNTIRALTLLNVGYASEVKNKSSINLSIAWKNGQPIANSGYSLGSLQSDFGQRKESVNDLVDAFEGWTANDPTHRKIDEHVNLRTSLKSTGHELAANRSLLLPSETIDKFNEFLQSSEGRKTVWEMDLKQINEKLLPFAHKVIETPTFQSFDADNINPADQFLLLSAATKLYNQAEGHASTRRQSNLLERMSKETMSYMEIERFLATRVKEKDKVTGKLLDVKNDYIETGYEHAKQGAELFVKISESSTPLAAWLGDLGSLDLNVTTESDFKLDPRFQVLERLFRDPKAGKRFTESLEKNIPTRLALPNLLNDGTESIIGIDDQGVIFTTSADRSSYREFIDNEWRFNPDKDNQPPASSQSTKLEKHTERSDIPLEQSLAVAYKFIATLPQHQQAAYLERLVEVVTKNGISTIESQQHVTV